MKNLKRLSGVLSVILVGALLVGCSTNTTSDSVTEEKTTVAAEKETKAATKPATEPPAQPTTERKKTIDEVADEISKEFVDSEGYQVSPQSDGENIYLYVYTDNLNSVLSRCRTDGNFSTDCYELWLDYKSNWKGVSRALSNEYPDYTITIYLLDDRNTSLPVTGEFSYLAEFGGGYCTYDYSSN